MGVCGQSVAIGR